MFSKEERQKRENKILGQFREMIHEKLKKTKDWGGFDHRYLWICRLKFGHFCQSECNLTSGQFKFGRFRRSSIKFHPKLKNLNQNLNFLNPNWETFNPKLGNVVIHELKNTLPNKKRKFKKQVFVATFIFIDRKKAKSGSEIKDPIARGQSSNTLYTLGQCKTRCLNRPIFLSGY